MQILIVVVRYKMSFSDSETLAGLSQAFKVHPRLLDSMRVLIVDNSPSRLNNPQLSFPFEYRHFGKNLGVSGAYNRAMEIAEANGCPWMLLLDQDTTLTDNFLPRMHEYSKELEENTNIAAVAPFLRDGKRTISPGAFHFNRVELLSPPLSGEYVKKAYAANSGTLMRVASLREIGGFDEDFWLDLSDIVAFHFLYLRGKHLYIAGDLQLQHKVTLNDYDGSMSPERYRNFITAEGAYWDLYRSGWENTIQTARLLARSLKQYTRYKNKSFAKITWKYFCSRLLTSKTARLHQWKEQSLSRDIPAVSDGTVVG